MSLFPGLLSRESLNCFQMQMGHGRAGWGEWTVWQCNNSGLKTARPELLLQKVTLAASVSTAKLSLVLGKLPKELFSSKEPPSSPEPGVQCWCAAEHGAWWACGVLAWRCWHKTAPSISARNTFQPKNHHKGVGIICPVFESLCKCSPAPIARAL